MRFIGKSLLVVAATVGVAALALSATVVGNWKGRLVVDKKSIPRITDPEHKREFDKTLQSLQKLQMSLVLRENKTWSATQTTGEGPKDISEGTWSLTANKVTLKVLKDNGKPPKGDLAKPQILTLSNDGKTLTYPLPEDGGTFKASFVLSRG